MASPVTGSCLPTTAASATAGWSTSADSTSMVLMRCPDTFMTSSTRPEQPEVALLVTLGAVAREVHALEAAPVGGLVALRIAVDAAEHARPGPLQHQVAALPQRHRLARGVDDVGVDAREREGGAAGLGGGDAGQRRDEDMAGLGLPPRVHDRRLAATDVLVVPEPGLRVDGLAHAAQQLQRRQVVPAGSSSPCFMKARMAVGAV